MFILGDRDQFTTPEDLGEYTTTVSAKVEILLGSDHFFYFREKAVSDFVLKGLLGAPTRDETHG